MDGIKRVVVSVVISLVVWNARGAPPEPIPVLGVTASGHQSSYRPERAVDGVISDTSRWVAPLGPEGRAWLEMRISPTQEVAGIHLYSGYRQQDAVSNFFLEFKGANGEWVDIPSARVVDNTRTELSIPFDTSVTVTSDTVRLVITRSKGNLARIREISLWPNNGKHIPPLDGELPPVEVPKIYLNQSGFNRGQPKRFTAPTLADGTPFQVVGQTDAEVHFEGVITRQIGDFTRFDPLDDQEYSVKANGCTSFPFRVGMWWLERVTYQNAVNFMIQSRHYFGSYKERCGGGSFGWRDDDHFAFELNTLVPQYLSNPSAYERMPRTVRYEKREGFNGALEPYREDIPDLVKLIHFGADVILTQGLDHELLKEQLAFFLYAWPVLKPWLPEQNYRLVSDYAFRIWSQAKCRGGYHYDVSKEHDILALKTTIGDTKGNLPPGHTVLPNLLMYEVAKREGRGDAEVYFQAASNQVDWLIHHLDWNDPLTTKGQRMSEHVTLTGLDLMLSRYPQRAPKGLREKIEDWKAVMVKRSENLWDFRKLSETQWVPTGVKRSMWNEPGNVLGFPACALAAIHAVPDSPHNQRLQQLLYAHFDNAFGRNPTGRHFSYRGPREIEGVDLGWYSLAIGGVGMLEKTPFVFDGAPKNEHYPYHPEVGDVGHTEGWVNFNTAFDLSLAYLARGETRLTADWEQGMLRVRLRAPLNFDYGRQERAEVQVELADGSVKPLPVLEETTNSEFFAGAMTLGARPKSVRYGYGYLAAECRFNDQQ